MDRSRVHIKESTMVHVSELIIPHPEVTSFGELEGAVSAAARAGEIHLYFDIRSEYPDTPRTWQQRLELAFCRAERRQE